MICGPNELVSYVSDDEIEDGYSVKNWKIDQVLSYYISFVEDLGSGPERQFNFYKV
jgi:hypothetical protein